MWGNIVYACVVAAGGTNGFEFADFGVDWTGHTPPADGICAVTLNHVYVTNSQNGIARPLGSDPRTFAADLPAISAI